MTMKITHAEERDAYVTVSEAARLAFVSADTMRRYANDGLIPVYRTPKNHRRFLVSDVRALVESQRSAAKAA